MMKKAEPTQSELARQLSYIAEIRAENDAFEQANGRKKKFYSLAMGCQMISSNTK